MNLKLVIFLPAILLVTGLQVLGQQKLKTRNVVLVTLDGMRWQEVFRGADKQLINSDYTRDQKRISSKFWLESEQERRKVLLPFFWSTLSQNGQLYGNRDLGNKAEVANQYHFSYPGYNELLTGFPDDRVNSNDKNYNPNVNLLEYVNKQKGFEGKVASFSSWDVFPYILNDKRSGLLVNSGIQDLNLKNMSKELTLLNQLQQQSLSPVGDDVRQDVFTCQFSKQYMKQYKPRLMYIAFDETDDYAHAGAYHYYLKQAQKEDAMLADLWNYIQSDPFYKDQTTLIITCDHGRGETPLAAWKDHGAKVEGSEYTWVAVIGPDTPAKGEMKASEDILYHKQIAQTISVLLGLDFKSASGHETGTEIKSFYK